MLQFGLSKAGPTWVGSSRDLDTWLITVGIVSPLTGVLVPLPNGLKAFINGGLLSTYMSWDDPPSMVDARNPAAVETLYETPVNLDLFLFGDLLRFVPWDSSPLRHHLVLVHTFSKAF